MIRHLWTRSTRPVLAPRGRPAASHWISEVGAREAARAERMSHG